MKTKGTSENKILGNKFEGYVGTLYYSIGYKVSYNVLLDGQQIDLLAEKMVPGSGLSKLMIECKFVTAGTVSNQEVFDFISVAQTLLQGNGITKAIMVSSTGFSEKGWAAANKNQFVELIPVRSLEDQLFDLGSTYRSFVETYEAAEIYNEYVELSGIYHEDLKGEGKKKIKDIETFMYKWLKGSTNTYMTVFGDFGTGKTTLLNRLKYVAAKAYVEGQSTLKPFLINLKDFYKYDTIDKLLTYSALREFEREISLQLIYRQIEAGQLILLLDGFDEMAQQVDDDIRMRNFMYLSPLLSKRAIITCRPSYFVSSSEYQRYNDNIFRQSALNDSVDTGSYTRNNMAQRELINSLAVYLTQEFITPHSLKAGELLDFEMIEIEALAPSSVDDFLQKNDREFKRVLGFNWIKVKDFLLDIYDIKDLMTRPMLLKMITKTLLSKKIDLRNKHSNIGPAELYELYTSLYLDIDFQKGDTRKLFTPDQRRGLSISIALLMFEQRSLEVDYQQLLDFISGHRDLKSVLGNVTHLTFEKIVADIQICTFLVASESGSFRFAHKSFMEFFVARYMKGLMVENKPPKEFNQMLPKELLYFLGSFSTSDNTLTMRIAKWMLARNAKASSKVLNRNLASVILYGGAVINDLDWSELEISFIEFKRRSLRNVSIEKVNMVDVDFIDATFYGNKWYSVHLRHVKLTNCEIHGSEWSTIIDGLEILNLNVSNSNLSFSGKGLSWNDGVAKESKLNFSGDVVIASCMFYSTTINWDAGFPGAMHFRECSFDQGGVIWPMTSKALTYQFSGCTFENMHIELLDSGFPTKTFDNCVFENCKLANLRIDLYMFKTTSFIECTGYVIVEDRAVADKEMELLKQPGNVLFFKKQDFYYIPEQTWALSRRDFKVFEKKISK